MSDGSIVPSEVAAVLREFKDPESGRDVATMEQVRDVEQTGDRLSLTLELTTHSAPLWEDTRRSLHALLTEKLPSLGAVEIELAEHDRPPSKLGEVGLTAKSVIAIGSGKGGVGKSTVSAAIAAGLTRAGCRVGLLDADVYGPSIPHLFGVDQQPEITEESVEPVVVDGIRLMSMGLLVPPGEAVMWRGPMLHGAISQLLRDTNWGDLDYLIIDMPPGTGDVALTLGQLLPLTGAVVVCTPQDVALLDAVKAITMFKRLDIPVLGMIENMSGFVCPDCGGRHDIFGSGGARRRAEQLDVPVLGQMPINMGICTGGDAGKVASLVDDPTVGPELLNICHRLSSNLASAAASSPPTPTLNIL